MPVPPSSSAPDSAERIARLEARVAKLEAYLEIDDVGVGTVPVLPPRRAATEDDLEQEVGQKWFARFGILALACGGGYMLTLPYPSLPSVLPPAVGLVVAGGLFGVAHAGRHRFALAAAYLRGAAMALLYCAALRLSFFTAAPALSPDGVAAHLVLTSAAGFNLWLAWRRASAPLMALALVCAAATPVALGDTLSVLIATAALSAGVGYVGSRERWEPLLAFGAMLTYTAYCLWAMGDPVLGRPYHWTPSFVGPLLLLVGIAVIATVPIWRHVPPDAPAAGVAALVNAVAGYGVFLVHTYATAAQGFALLQTAATVVFLSLAALLWLKFRSQIATFFYAMAAYAALTTAIVHLAQVPDVFVWLSAESVLVVATAIWFQSRFIVVTNFVIYVIVVLGYLLLNERESGASIGFGIVALISARILNWQRHRLALQTHLMRNAYLVSAFVVFPYALYHLATPRFAALAWVALAVAYYALNRVIQNQKYRWMGHATLVLTTVYLVIPRHAGMTPTLRIASFLAVGAALLVVSLVFTHSRRSAGGGTQK